MQFLYKIPGYALLLFGAFCLSWGGFIAASIYLTDRFENHGLWFSLMFFMILRALTLKFYFNKILRKF